MTRGTRQAFALIAPFSLAACGGAGGGLVSTPTPPASYTVPAPSQTPTNTAFVDPMKSENFNNLSVHSVGTMTTNNVKGTSITLPGSDATISYDAASNTYTLSMPQASADGTSPDATKVMTTSSDYCYVTPCIHVSGPAFGAFSRRGASATNSLGFLYTYVSFAYWSSITTSGDDKVITSNYAVFGSPTAAAGVPRSGTGNYSLDIHGFETTGPLGNSGGHAITGTLSGTGTAAVDFGAGTYAMNGSINAPVAQTTGSFSSSGSLSASANGFSGSFNMNDGGAFTGTLGGWFFGPKADELGAVFSAKASDGRVAVGAITGH